MFVDVTVSSRILGSSQITVVTSDSLFKFMHELFRKSLHHFVWFTVCITPTHFWFIMRLAFTNNSKFFLWVLYVFSLKDHLPRRQQPLKVTAAQSQWRCEHNLHQRKGNRWITTFITLFPPSWISSIAPTTGWSARIALFAISKLRYANTKYICPFGKSMSTIEIALNTCTLYVIREDCRFGLQHQRAAMKLVQIKFHWIKYWSGEYPLEYHSSKQSISLFGQQIKTIFCKIWGIIQRNSTMVSTALLVT